MYLCGNRGINMSIDLLNYLSKKSGLFALGHFDFLSGQQKLRLQITAYHGLFE